MVAEAQWAVVRRVIEVAGRRMKTEARGSCDRWLAVVGGLGGRLAGKVLRRSWVGSLAGSLAA